MFHNRAEKSYFPPVNLKENGWLEPYFIVAQMATYSRIIELLLTPQIIAVQGITHNAFFQKNVSTSFSYFTNYLITDCVYCAVQEY